MALINAYEQARLQQTRRDNGPNPGFTKTPFFGSRNDPNSPLASLNAHDPGYFNSTHFHNVDQFQVVVEGKGTLGKHEISPYSVHFTRAYTPYGPLIAD